jgi:hypothetical protein
MLRAGATLSPDWLVRNLIRDAVNSGVVSRTGFVPGLDTARGLKHTLARDEAYWKWIKAGGSQASLVSMDRTRLRKTLKEIDATGYMNKVWNVVRNPVEGLRMLSELSENATRLGEFGKAEARFGSDKAGIMRAAYEARDLMDFARRGRLTASFNRMTAFFNAGLQGLDRSVRAFKENPKRALIRTALFIGVPSVVNALRNYGDEAVEEVPRAQRDLFWIVPAGEGRDKVLARIPKPFEAGVLFGSSLERATEFILDAYTQKYKGDTGKAKREAFRGLGKSVWDISAPNMIPTFAVPWIESYANRSITFDRPIIPRNREGMLPEYQYAPYTTELTRAISRVVGKLPAVGEMDTFSPARTEHFIRGYTGSLGMYLLEGLDYAGRKTGMLPDPVKPASAWHEGPFFRAFTIRHPSMRAESVERFYQSYDKARAYISTINGLQKDFKYEEAANLMPYMTYQAIEGPHRVLNDLLNSISLVIKAPNINADEKRQLLDALYFRVIDTARQGNTVFETLEENLEQWRKRAEAQKKP